MVTVEGSSPSVQLTTTADNRVNGSYSAAITFSEPVTGFAVSDLEAMNATLTGFSGTGATYVVTVVPPPTDR